MTALHSKRKRSWNVPSRRDIWCQKQFVAFLYLYRSVKLRFLTSVTLYQRFQKVRIEVLSRSNYSNDLEGTTFRNILRKVPLVMTPYKHPKQISLYMYVCMIAIHRSRIARRKIYALIMLQAWKKKPGPYRFVILSPFLVLRIENKIKS